MNPPVTDGRTWANAMPCAVTQALLCCARTRMDGVWGERFTDALERCTDWDRLLAMAGRHGLLPLLHHHIARACPDAVPADVLKRLSDHFEGNVKRSLLLSARLLHLHQVLASHGVRSLPLRGPALAALFYGDAALRACEDIDLLVCAGDMPAAQRILEGEGYRPQLELSRARRAAYVRSNCDLLFTRPDDWTGVELHWAVTPAYFCFPIDIPGVLARANRGSLSGLDLPVPAWDDMMLMHCAHATKHRWSRMLWACDVAEALRGRSEEELRQLLSRASRLGARRMVQIALLLAGDFLGAPLPQSVVEEARGDSAGAGLAAQALESFSEDGAGTFDPRLRMRFHLSARERPADRISYCLRLALTPTVADWSVVSLPDALYPLYYVVRPARLLLKRLRPPRAAQ